MKETGVFTKVGPKRLGRNEPDRAGAGNDCI